jgi:hypothetical protein
MSRSTIELTGGTSPRVLARIAGFLYLLNIVAGFFAIGLVPAALIVTGDSTATAQNIQANELMYRSGLVAHILITATNLPLAVIFYDLFKVVSRRLALMVAFLLLVGTAVEVSALLDQFEVLTVLSRASYLNAFTPEQLQALAYRPLDMIAIGYSMSTVFFGLYGLTIGYLVFRSTFLPRIVGVLLVIGGLAYLTASFATFLAPTFAARLFPYIGLPSLLGEGSFCMSLLVIGVDAQRWTARARAAERPPAPVT